MAWSSLLSLSAVIAQVAAQGAQGQTAAERGMELDKPMLRGPPRRATPVSMLRFGCSQVVIERLDP